MGDPDSAGPMNPSISPDGRRVALHRNVNGNADIWLLETGTGRAQPVHDRRGGRSRLRSGRRMAAASCSAQTEGHRSIFTRSSATGAGSEELLLATSQTKMATDWSSDGRFLLYREPGSEDRAMTSGRCRWMETESHIPSSGRISKNGTGNSLPTESGSHTSRTSRAALRFTSSRFPVREARCRISTNGGAQVRWRRDGKELFYIALDDRLMAVPIRLASNGQTRRTRLTQSRCSPRAWAARCKTINRQQYMVSPDGQRFLMNTVTEEADLAHHGHPELEAPGQIIFKPSSLSAI